MITNLDGEEWRPVVGYEGVSEVSNLGRIRSVPGKWREALLRKLRVMPNGYISVGLTSGGVMRTFYVHRLVAAAFLENPLNLRCVDHINANKEDNRAENLEWVDSKENNRRAIAMGLMNQVRGEGCWAAKLTSEKAREIRALYRNGIGATKIAARYGIKRRTVYNVLDRDTWGHISDEPRTTMAAA